MFYRRFADAAAYGRKVRPLLDCLVAARDPLPKQLLPAASGLKESLAEAALGLLRQFLRVDETGLRVFHRSVVDWLTGETAGKYQAYPRQGHQRLAEACWQEYSDPGEEMSAYARAHLAVHLCRAQRWPELILAYVSPRLELLDRWLERGELEQGVECLSALVDQAGLPPARGAGLATQLARLHDRRGDYDQAEKRLEQAVADTDPRTERRTRAAEPRRRSPLPCPGIPRKARSPRPRGGAPRWSPAAMRSLTALYPRLLTPFSVCPRRGG
jgi:tetratricopeptide (TPR) repeat protein